MIRLNLLYFGGGAAEGDEAVHAEIHAAENKQSGKLGGKLVETEEFHRKVEEKELCCICAEKRHYIERGFAAHVAAGTAEYPHFVPNKAARDGDGVGAYVGEFVVVVQHFHHYCHNGGDDDKIAESYDAEPYEALCFFIELAHMSGQR